jgi:hypothetical protein
MKMRVLDRLYGKRAREKKEKRKKERAKQKEHDKMPDFKKLFASLPNIIKAPAIPEDMETQHVPSVQDRAVAKSTAEQEVRTEAARNKTDDVFARIKTASG